MKNMGDYAKHVWVLITIVGTISSVNVSAYLMISSRNRNSLRV